MTDGLEFIAASPTFTKLFRLPRLIPGGEAVGAELMCCVIFITRPKWWRETNPEIRS